jgi:hypothetical protein
MKIPGRSAAVAFASAIAAAATLSLTATAANASVYTHTDMVRCYSSGYPAYHEACVEIFANSTYSGKQVWINGKVRCYLFPDVGLGAAEQSLNWCGVGGGNGTAQLNIGINWTDAGEGSSIPYLYERLDIPASGSESGPGCKSSGSNLKYGTVYNWSNYYYVCNWPGAGSPHGAP